MADDNMINETRQPTENGLENQRPDDTEDDEDVADDGKKCINQSVYKLVYSTGLLRILKHL